jgi:hypothetical protein
MGILIINMVGLLFLIISKIQKPKVMSWLISYSTKTHLELLKLAQGQDKWLFLVFENGFESSFGLLECILDLHLGIIFLL